jgi:hypothetical protein
VNIKAVGFRIERTARPVGTTDIGRQHQRGNRRLGAIDGRRGIQRPETILVGNRFGFGAQFRRQVVQIVARDALAIER